jgi:hypothetical protein
MGFAAGAAERDGRVLLLSPGLGFALRPGLRKTPLARLKETAGPPTSIPTLHGRFPTHRVS